MAVRRSTWLGIGSVALALVSPSCKDKEAEATAPPSRQAAGTGRPAEPPSLAAHVIRGKDRQKAQNQLSQIAIFYRLYNTDKGRSPAELEDFRTYIERDGPAESQALKDGHYVLVLNSPLGSRDVLAYEKGPDINGKHIVAMGDGHIENLTSEELQAALKGKAP
jgi:hypothetical protein